MKPPRSNAIWLLSTRGRPREAQETIDACMDTGMTSRGCVYVDETVDVYRNLKLPRNWTIHYEPKWGSLQASLQWCYEAYPDATQYGWLADDTRPRTPGWDTILETAAGDYCLSYARDLWLSERPNERLELEQGSNLSSGLCWGGELVRTVGWWATPGLRQAFIDVVWCRIIEPLGIQRYVHDVTVEHLNYRTGKRERDTVDDWSRGGDEYVQRDIENGWLYIASDEFVDVLRRVSEVAATVPASRVQIARTVQRLKDAHANAYWKPGMSAAALVRVMDRFDRSGKGREVAEILAAHAHQGQAGVDQALRRLGSGADVL